MGRKSYVSVVLKQIAKPRIVYKKKNTFLHSLVNCPTSIELFQRKFSGRAIEPNLFFNKIAVTPSGPTNELDLSSLNGAIFSTVFIWAFVSTRLP